MSRLGFPVRCFGWLEGLGLPAIRAVRALCVVGAQGLQSGEPLLARCPGGDVLAPFQFVPFPLKAGKQVLQAGAAGQEPVDGGSQLRLVAGAVLFRLVLDVALALVPAWDDDGQAMLFADAVAGAADLMVAPLVGVVVPVILETDRVENQVIMDVIPVNVSGEDKFIFAAQDLPCQLHADPVGFLWRDLPRLKRLDEVAAQVRALVDGMAAGPCKFNVGGLRGAAERRTPAASRPSCRDCRYSQSPLSALT